MKIVIRLLAAVVLLIAAVMAWSSWPRRIEPVALPAELTLPPAQPPAGMTLSALPTGQMDSKAAFAFRGGAFQEDRAFSMTPVLVHHPLGDLLIDAGFSRHADRHLADTTPWLMRKLSRIHVGSSAADQFAAAGYDVKRLSGVLLTHAHWDHVSGLADLPGVPVWMPERETAFIRDGGLATALARQLQPWVIRGYRFDARAHLGFAESYDVWGDGSVVIVPAPGHTPGSVIVFVTLPSGQRYGFVGDLVWQREGLEIPAERPGISSLLVDHDGAEVRRAVAHVAALRQRFPQIVWLPAHDARSMAQLPVFPAVAR